MATTSAVLAPNRCHSGVHPGSRPTCTKYPCWNLRSWISLCRAWKTMVSDNKWSQFYLTSVWRWLLPGVVMYIHLPYPKPTLLYNWPENCYLHLVNNIFKTTKPNETLVHQQASLHQLQHSESYSNSRRKRPCDIVALIITCCDKYSDNAFWLSRLDSNSKYAALNSFCEHFRLWFCFVFRQRKRCKWKGRINLFYQDLRFGQVIKNSIGVAAISSSINLGMQALGEHKYHCD